VERKHIFVAKMLVFLCLLIVLASCQSSGSQWPSTNLKQLATIIFFPYQPQQATWQAISLPVNNDGQSVPGPTDMVGVVAVLTFDKQTLAKVIEHSTPLVLDQEKPRISPDFVFDWYPQALRKHLVSSGPSSKIVTLPGYSIDPFLKSPDKKAGGSFFTRIPGTSELFLYYQHWHS
jgi:hypothetical protein